MCPIFIYHNVAGKYFLNCSEVFYLSVWLGNRELRSNLIYKPLKAKGGSLALKLNTIVMQHRIHSMM